MLQSSPDNADRTCDMNELFSSPKASVTIENAKRDTVNYGFEEEQLNEYNQYLFDAIASVTNCMRSDACIDSDIKQALAKVNYTLSSLFL